MDYKLTDLIDIQRTQRLLQNFLSAVGVPAAIIDLNGTVLVTSPWKRVCTDFHRQNEITCRRCLESDTVLANDLLKGKTFSLYRCPNGLTDAASPIIIEGKHLANAFIGQFFIKEPDLEFFRGQAKEFGFDEPAYLDALSEAPIVAKETLTSILSFLTSFAEMTAGLGLKQLRQLETEKELREARLRLENQNEELRASEEDLHHAQAVAHIGSWRMDVQRNSLHWSDESYRIFGISRGMPMTYDSFLAAVHPEDREFVNRMWQDALGGMPYDIEHRILVGDEVKWVHEQAELEFDEEGVLNGGFGTVQDITERKLMEDDLRKSRNELELRVRERTSELKTYTAKLEQSNQALQEFASIASHDMKEPLRKIISFGNLLRQNHKNSLGQTGNDYLNRMLNATQRMQSLITSLLEYSRVTMDQEPFQETDLYDLVHEVLSDLEVRIAKTGGEVQVGELPSIAADPTQMRQLFQNLIGNALKFHKPGEKPMVQVRSTSHTDSECQIIVEDNGIGFEEQYIERIFAPFQRLHGRNSQYEGTGMGLAICKKIVERHGGAITASSEPGKGSTFTVTLPMIVTGGSPKRGSALNSR